MLPFDSISSIFYCIRLNPFFFFFFSFFTAIRWHSLGKFYLECVQQARLFTNRSFHSLVTLQRLATWGLRPKPFAEALAHELTTLRRKLFCLKIFPYLFYPSSNIFFLCRDSNYERKQGEGLGGRGDHAKDPILTSSNYWRQEEDFVQDNWLGKSS